MTGVALFMILFPLSLGNGSWSVPIVVGALSTIPVFFMWLSERSIVVQIAHSHCTRCGFSLSGLPRTPNGATFCPECGAPNPPAPASAPPAPVQ